MAFGGQSLTGTFSFSKRGDDVLVAATGVTVSLGSTVAVTAGTGVLLLTPAGVAGRLSAQIRVTVPGIEIGTGLTLSVNSTATAVSTSVDVGGTTLVLDLPAGPYLRVEGTGLTVTVQGQSLTADVVVERATVAGAPVTTIALNRVDLTIGAGGNGVRITGGTGLFLVTTAGVAGRVSGTVVVTLPAGTSLTGALTLAVNTTSSAVTASVDVAGTLVALDVRAGPYLRFEGTGMVLTVLGQSLRGDLVIERSTSYGGDGLPGGTGPDARHPDRPPRDEQRRRWPSVAPPRSSPSPTARPCCSSGQPDSRGGSPAPSRSRSRRCRWPAPSWSRSTRPSAPVNETFTVGAGAPVVLALPVGPYLRISGTGVTLSVLGQTLTGNVVITRTTDAGGAPVVRIRATGVTLRLGGTPAAPVVSLTQVGTADLVLTSAGLAGRVVADIALNVPDVSVTGSVEVAVNTHGRLRRPHRPHPPRRPLPADRRDRTSASPSSARCSRPTSSSSRSPPQRAPRSCGSGSPTPPSSCSAPRAPRRSPSSAAAASSLVSPAGIAGSFGGSLVLSLGGALRLTGDFELEVNTTGDRVAESLQVGTTSSVHRCSRRPVRAHRRDRTSSSRSAARR